MTETADPQTSAGAAGPGRVVAVAGATGRVGGHLARSLTEHGLNVRALTRDPARAAQLLPDAAATAIDLDSPATLDAALQGVDTLLISLGSSPRQVEDEVSLIDAAVRAGVGHLVKVSSMGGPSTLHPMDWHARIETHLAVQPMGFSVLRPSPFLDVLAPAGPAVRAGRWGGSAGDGRTSFIDTRDVADVAARIALDDPGPDIQRSYHLTGARTWTMDEVAQQISDLVGKQVTYQRRDAATQRTILDSGGLPDLVVGILLGIDSLICTSALAEHTGTVLEITGHQPRTLQDWLAENRTLFQVRANT